MSEDRSVVVVDDDLATRESICDALEVLGYPVQNCPSAEAYLSSHLNQEGCVLIDFYMPGMNGLQLLAEIRRRGCRIPVVMMTGGGDIPLAVRAIKAGATDFLEKPVSLADLSRTTDAAFQPPGGGIGPDNSSELVARLSQREMEVLALIASGLSNKVAALSLKVSHRTVEYHRANILEKTGARNLADLVRIYLAIESK